MEVSLCFLIFENNASFSDGMFPVKGCSRIDSIILGQYAVYNNLREKERKAAFVSKHTAEWRQKAMVMWPYTGMGLLYYPLPPLFRVRSRKKLALTIILSSSYIRPYIHS